jgi:hypothetical protein
MLVSRDILPVKVWKVLLKIVHITVIISIISYHIKM